jgi:hypothetical protein
VAVADTSGPGRWPCQLSQMTLRMNIAGFTLSSYPVGFAPHEWLRSSTRTSLSVWALPVSIGSNLWSLPRSGLCCVWFGVFAFGLGLMGRTFGHTASTGAVTGVTLDPSGAVLPGVGVDLSKKGGGERKSATSDENRRFGFPLLPPSKYELQRANKISSQLVFRK